jgi:hypothetical protein
MILQGTRHEVYRKARYNIFKKSHFEYLARASGFPRKNRWPSPFVNNQVSKTVFRARDQMLNPKPQI